MKHIAIKNKKLRGALGETRFDISKSPKKPISVQIDVKKHDMYGKNKKRQLASTIKHELLHVKHPNMTEKQVYHKSRVSAITDSEQSKLLAKMKTINYKGGAIKRKFHLSGKTKPGDMISKMNENKKARITTNKPISETKTSIMGLV